MHKPLNEIFKLRILLQNRKRKRETERTKEFYRFHIRFRFVEYQNEREKKI